MAKKKFFGGGGNAGMPQNVITKSYPKRDYAIMEGGYVDTQSELDAQAKKAISKVKKGMRK